MKTSVKVLIAILLAPVVLYLLICLVFAVVPQLDPYDFPYKDEPIESVELYYHPWADDHDNEEYLQFRFIRELEPEEVPVFMERLYELPTVSPVGSPPSNYGPYIAIVNYENGDAEYYGSWNIEVVEAGTQAWAVGGHCFFGDAFDELFLKYAGSIDYRK
ncbi:MAG: hypothetical protein IKB09_05385 [Oscillospiraceae bacterium]|nr:hypothetical protein [Oscillospiraceae bacterium]